MSSVRAILNPHSGSGETEAIADGLRAHGVEVVLPEGKEAARECLSAFGRAGGRLLLGGGDGTLHHAVNILEDHLDALEIGVLPLGTGNDFRRSLGIPDAPEEALQVALETGTLREVDLMELEWSGGRCLALNTVTAGNAGLVLENVRSEDKKGWGGIAYLNRAVSVALDHEVFDVRIVINDSEEIEGRVVNILAANGRQSAGGLVVAPTADLHDGVFELVVIREGSLLELGGVAARLLARGRHLSSESVSTRRPCALRVTGRPELPLCADGEVLGRGDFSLRLRPRLARFVCGPRV